MYVKIAYSSLTSQRNSERHSESLVFASFVMRVYTFGFQYRGRSVSNAAVAPASPQLSSFWTRTTIPFVCIFDLLSKPFARSRSTNLVFANLRSRMLVTYYVIQEPTFKQALREALHLKSFSYDVRRMNLQALREALWSSDVLMYFASVSPVWL